MVSCGNPACSKRKRLTLISPKQVDSGIYDPFTASQTDGIFYQPISLRL